MLVYITLSSSNFYINFVKPGLYGDRFLFRLLFASEVLYER